MLSPNAALWRVQQQDTPQDTLEETTIRTSDPDEINRFFVDNIG